MKWISRMKKFVVLVDLSLVRIDQSSFSAYCVILGYNLALYLCKQINILILKLLFYSTVVLFLKA